MFSFFMNKKILLFYLAVFSIVGCGGISRELKLLEALDQRDSDKMAEITKMIKLGGALKEEFLGRGSFKDVYKGTWKGQEVAVAYYENTIGGRIEFHRDISFYSSYQHRNILRAFAYSVNHKFIVLEKAEMTLRDYLNENGYLDRPPSKGNLDKDKPDKDYPDMYLALMDAFIGIARGIRYLHYMLIIHADIKPSNIVFCREGELLIPKLIDFDGVIYIPPFFQSSASKPELLFKETRRRNYWRFVGLGSEVGTPLYSPVAFLDPKMIKLYRFETDIYSLGVIFFEALLAKSYPKGKSKEESSKFKKVFNRELNYFEKNHFSISLQEGSRYLLLAYMKDLIFRMLDYDFKKRPGIQDVLNALQGVKARYLKRFYNGFSDGDVSDDFSEGEISESSSEGEATDIDSSEGEISESSSGGEATGRDSSGGEISESSSGGEATDSDSSEGETISSWSGR